MNPLLSIDDFDVNEIINEILNNIPRYAVNITCNEIKLQTELEGGIFKFAVNLTRATAQEFWTEVTLPLCQSVADLQSRNNYLIQEINWKDEQIYEYKAHGAQLLRSILIKYYFHLLIFSNIQINRF